MQITLRAYNQIIEDLLENDQIDEVIAHCRHILQEYPNHLDTLRTLGKASLDHGNLDHSTNAFTQVLRSLPSDFVSNLGISFIYQSQGDIAKAIWYLERVFESNPNNVMVQDELKKLMTTRDGKTPDRLNKTNAILAQIYANSGEYLRAIEEITAIIADDPRRADMKTLLVKIYFEMNDSRRALEACEDCFHDSPYNMDALRYALRLAEKIGANDQAAEWRKRILDLDPYAIDPSTMFLAGDKALPDDLVMIDKLDWAPTEAVPNDLEETAPRESVGDSDEDGEPFLEPSAETGEPIEEIPVEQDTPQWLKDLLSEAKGASAIQKFDREAGDSMPAWVRELKPETAPRSAEDKGLTAAELAKANQLAVNGSNSEPQPTRTEFTDDTSAEAFTPDLSDDWRPIPVEREDPIEALAATRKSNRSWYAEHELKPTKPASEPESKLAFGSDPLEKVSSTQLTTPIAKPAPAGSPAPTDWRDDLDLDWIGSPRPDDVDAGDEDELTRGVMAEDGVTPEMVATDFDASALEWLGDLSKPESAAEPDWLGDLSHPMDATMKSPAIRVETPDHARGALPDMPNILLPEGSMLPKEPIEVIPQSAIEETSDPAILNAMVSETLSTENAVEDVELGVEGDDSAGEDFYASLQNPPAENQIDQRVDDETTLIGNVGGNFLEPIEEIVSEESASIEPPDDRSPNVTERESQFEEEESDGSAPEPIEQIVAETDEAVNSQIAALDDEATTAETPQSPLEPIMEIEADSEDNTTNEPIEALVPESEASPADPIDPSEFYGAEALKAEVDPEGLVPPTEEGFGEDEVRTQEVASDEGEFEELQLDEPADEELEVPYEAEPADEGLADDDNNTGEEMIAEETFDPESADPELDPSDEVREEQHIGSAFERGKRYLENGQLDKALSEFSDLIKYERMIDQILPILRDVADQNPTNKRALRTLGDAFFNADMLEDALATYAKADDLTDDEEK